MPSETRRTLLRTATAALAAGLVGCQGRSSAPADGSTTATTTTGPSTTVPSTATTATDLGPPLAGVWRQGDVPGRVERLALTDGPLRLIVATGDGELLGLDADGTVAWRRSTRDPLGVPTAITVVGDAVLVVGGDPTAEKPYTTLTVREAATGAVRWSERRRAFLAPLAEHDGRLYVSGGIIRKPVDELGPNEPRSRSGWVRAYGLADGRVRAKLAIDSAFGATVAHHGVYVRRVRPGTDGAYSLVSYDRSLAERWRVDTDSQYATEPLTTDRGVIYPLERQLVHWAAESGARLWTVEGLAEPPVAPHRLPDGTVYAGSPVRAIDPDGTVRRTLPSSVYGTPLPAPSGGAVYFDAGDRLARVDQATGEVSWRFEPTSSPYLTLLGLLADAVVVTDDFGSTDELLVLDPATGTERGTRSVRARTHTAVRGADGRLYVGTTRGVTAFEPAREGS